MSCPYELSTGFGHSFLRFFQQQFGCGRLLLACTQLRFTHPGDGRELTIDAPLEENFAGVLHELQEQGDGLRLQATGDVTAAQFSGARVD